MYNRVYKFVSLLIFNIAGKSQNESVFNALFDIMVGWF